MRPIISNLVFAAWLAAVCLAEPSRGAQERAVGAAADERAFRAAVEAAPGVRVAAMQAFLADYPESEYRDVVYPQLLEALAADGASEELDRAVCGYIEGTAGQGSGRVALAYVSATDVLLRHDSLPARRAALIDQALGPVAQGMPADVRSRFLSLLSRTLLRHKAYDQAASAAGQALKAAMPDPPGELYFTLGKIHEARGDHDAALDAYLDAGSRRGPREILEALRDAYTKKYGSLDGLHEKLDALRLARPRAFDPGRYARPPGDAAASTVLVELFTGAECGPCVAADIAVGGLLDRFDRDTVAVLQYHIHAPGPDPLANPDSVRRSEYYGVAGTPTGFVGGTARVYGGGGAGAGPRLFSMYAAKIEPLIPKPPRARFGDVRFASEGGAVRVSGRATVDAGAARDRLRLRIALVEEVVHYTGGNGVHFHHFVVRKLLGPENGATFDGADTLAFSESIPLEALSGSLKAYLDRFEKEEETDRPGFRFEEKPAVVDPGKLGVVVFVQDDGTSEVLNSTFAR